MDNFASCIAFTLQAEGGYSANAADPGNWTGRAVGMGVLRGTKCGISAASYPDLDIEHLTQPQIEAIYRRDYFEKIQGDILALPLAMVAFDAAVNAGVRRSIVFLQQAGGVPGDGILGPHSLQVLTAGHAGTLALEALARRLDYYAKLPGWSVFGLGWARRILQLARIVGV